MERASIISLVSYQYDALDRLVNRASAGQHRQHRFYQKERIVTEIEGNVHRQIFQCQEALLAELETNRVPRTSLLTTDTQRSVLRNFDSHSAYSPYGHRTVTGGLSGLLGFNGERLDPSTEHYLLGNGHRGFNPTLMRFNSPDSLSPFGTGGLNCYVYCGGDPINRTDPTGRTWYGWAWFVNSALGFVDDYVVPRLPKRLARQIPAVGNRTFGEVTKSMSKAGGLSASVLYLVMNRVEAYYPLSPVNDPLFYAFLTSSTFAVANSAAHTLHRLARRLAQPMLPLATPLRRTTSLPDLRSNSRLPTSTSTSNSSSPQMPSQQAKSAAKPNEPRDSLVIRQGL